MKKVEEKLELIISIMQRLKQIENIIKNRNDHPLFLYEISLILNYNYQIKNDLKSLIWDYVSQTNKKFEVDSVLQTLALLEKNESENSPNTIFDKMPFYRPSNGWQRLMRHIRVNGEVISLKEEEIKNVVPNHISEGHLIVREKSGKYLWKCSTISKLKNKGAIEKTTNYIILLNGEGSFINGYMYNSFSGILEMKKSDFIKINMANRKFFMERDYWDVIE